MNDQTKLAEGCCSASFPCSHQKSSPYTICEACRTATLREVTIIIPKGYANAAEFLKDCQFEAVNGPEIKAMRDALQKINGLAHFGAMLGGDSAYQACLTIESITAALFTSVKGASRCDHNI